MGISGKRDKILWPFIIDGNDKTLKGMNKITPQLGEKLKQYKIPREKRNLTVITANLYESTMNSSLKENPK